MKNFKFFVYGTLKKGGRFSDKFNAKRKSVEVGKTYGTMYSVNGDYPAVIFEPDGELLYGEIHEYNDEKEVMLAFDLIEGFVEKDYIHNLYNRKKILVLNSLGNYVKCITYEFNRKVDTFSKVKSGFWET